MQGSTIVEGETETETEGKETKRKGKSTRGLRPYAVLHSKHAPGGVPPVEPMYTTAAYRSALAGVLANTASALADDKMECTNLL